MRANSPRSMEQRANALVVKSMGAETVEHDAPVEGSLRVASARSRFVARDGSAMELNLLSDSACRRTADYGRRRFRGSADG